MKIATKGATTSTVERMASPVAAKSVNALTFDRN
jgi:hypothetical protein